MQNGIILFIVGREFSYNMSHNVATVCLSRVQSCLNIDVLFPLVPDRARLSSLGKRNLVDILTSHALADDFLSINQILSLNFKVLIRVHELLLECNLVGPAVFALLE